MKIVSFDFRLSLGEAAGSRWSVLVCFPKCVVGMVRVEGRLTTGLIDDTGVYGRMEVEGSGNDDSKDDTEIFRSGSG